MKIVSTIPLYHLISTLLLTYLGTSIEAGDMTYVGLPDDLDSPGGFCMDGSMAGYYIRKGSDPSLFVIYLRGGGGCSTEEDCTARNGTYKGSSTLWEPTYLGERHNDGNCATNPDFCNAISVHVPYCTGDGHMGSNYEPDNSTWGFYFDGHSNFAAIVEHLIKEHGLAEADNVLLTGGSAGSMGTYFNVDWLAERLSKYDIAVKGAPNAGWYTPGSLPGDLPEIFAPSDFNRYTAGGKGNAWYDTIMLLNGTVALDRFRMKELLSPDCLAARGDAEWWACASVDVAYKYIKSPLFNVHSQYDSNQIFSTKGFVPKDPETEEELAAVESYISMWGEATRVSMQQVLDDATVTTKDYPDGLFSTSCLSHGTWGTTIDGMTWQTIVRDWFFDLGEMKDYYRLMETCDVEEGGIELPCNEAKNCGFQAQPPKPEPYKKCADTMIKLGCVESYGDKKECGMCVRKNKKKLGSAGCTKTLATKLCKYAEKNEFEDDGPEDDDDLGEIICVDSKEAFKVGKKTGKCTWFTKTNKKKKKYCKKAIVAENCPDACSKVGKGKCA